MNRRPVDGTTAQAVVPVHDDEGPSVVAMLWALGLGCASAMLLYTGAGLLSVSAGADQPPGWYFGAFFVGGWMFSAWLLAWHTRRALEVVTRGFLLGTCEWLGVVLLGVFVPADVVSALGRGSATEPGTWLMGRWLAPMVQGLTPVVLGLLCLLAFVFCSLLGRLLLPGTDAPAEVAPLRAEDPPRDPTAS